MKFNGDTSRINFSVDWSLSDLDPSDISNLSIYAYPEDGSAPYVRISGDVESGYINLPTGLYSFLVFNDIAGDIAGVEFIDVESYTLSRVEAESTSLPGDLYYTLLEGELLSKSIGQIALWRKEEFEVVVDEVNCPYCGSESGEDITLEVQPSPITTQCHFTLGVENLRSAHIIQGVVRGFASGAYLSSGERFISSSDTYIYSMNFGSAQFDDSMPNSGTVQSEITTFGKAAVEPLSYELEISVILNSGEKMSFTRDITEQVTAQSNSRIEILLESEDNKIVLPEGVGTGFGVNGWGDKESIKLL